MRAVGRRHAAGVILLVLGCLVTASCGAASRVRDASARAAELALGTVRSAAADPHLDAWRPPPLPPGARRAVVRIAVGPLSRQFVDVAPASATGPLPLVVVLHGRRQTPWRAESSQRWDLIAARREAVVAYGAGFGGSWNAGSCCGPAERAGVDDVGYLLQVIGTEERRHAVDPRRVYLVGFSNGGMLAYRFACAHARVLAGLAVVGGSLQVPDCRPAVPLDVLDVQGDRDRVVPYGGSPFSLAAGAPTTSIPDSLRPWQQVARRGAVVRVVRLPRLGHTWPTVQGGGWDGTAQIWRFLTGSAEAPTGTLAMRS